MHHGMSLSAIVVGIDERAYLRFIVFVIVLAHDRQAQQRDLFLMFCSSRSDTKRGYQATSLTHGRVYSLVVADLLEIMMRPQHSSFLDMAFKRIRLLIAANMIQYFGRAVRRAVNVRALSKAHAFPGSMVRGAYGQMN